MKIIWSPFAIEKMQEIVEYISADNPEAGEQFARNVFEKVDRLEELPKIGRVVPEMNKDTIREIIFGNYRIIYSLREKDKEVYILTVRHAKRQFDLKS